MTHEADDRELAQLNARLEERVAERTVELHAAQQRLKFLLTSSPVVIYSCKPTPDYRATFMSETVRSIVGYEAQQFLNDPGFWLEHVHPDDAADVLASIEHSFSRGKPVQSEYRFRCADGQYRWMHDEATPITDESGTVQEFIGYWIDVTARRQAELLLRESASPLGVVFARAAAGIAQIDLSGRVTFVNERYCEITGYTREDLLGMRLQDMIYPDDLPKSLEPFQSLVHGKPGFAMEHRYSRKNGVPVWVSSHVGAVPDLAGVLQSFVAVVVDVTERKRVEDALDQQQRELQQSHTQLQDLTSKLLLAQDRERQRIACDLHDDFGQRLAALAMNVAALARRSAASQNVLPDALTPVREEIERLNADLRNVAHHLSPPVLTHLGLQAAIEDHIQKAIQRTGLRITLTVTNFPDVIPSEVVHVPLSRVPGESPECGEACKGHRGDGHTEGLIERDRRLRTR